jgi:hypothetical protein
MPNAAAPANDDRRFSVHARHVKSAITRGW